MVGVEVTGNVGVVPRFEDARNVCYFLWEAWPVYVVYVHLGVVDCDWLFQGIPLGYSFSEVEVEVLSAVCGAFWGFISCRVKRLYNGEVGGCPLAKIHGSWMRRIRRSVEVFDSLNAESLLACPFVQFGCCTWTIPVLWMLLMRQQSWVHSGMRAGGLLCLLPLS